MRLIDADALKENVKHQAGICRLLNSDAMREYANIMEFGFCKEIDNAPTIDSQPQWILCSEKSPQKSGNYIVTERRYSMDDRKNEGKYQKIVEEIRFTGEKWDRAKFFDIIAWMPLPEPYKEGNNEIN